MTYPGGLTLLMSVYERDDPRLFQRAVESVYANSVTPDEFVLVVDGPTPPDLDGLIRRFEAERGFRLVRLARNTGLANALNHGLGSVRTEWVARADADDLNLPDRFHAQAEALREHAFELDILGGVIEEVDEAGVVVAMREVPLRHDEIVSRLVMRNPFNHMTVVYRTRSVIDAGGYPGIHLREDYGLWAAMIARGARCGNIDRVLVRATAGPEMYRRRGGLRYARAEWSLQRHLLRLGRTAPVSAVLFGAIRVGVFLLPVSTRGWFYERALRRRTRGM